MAIVVAVNKLGVSDPECEMRHTGTYDKLGNPVLRKSTNWLPPGVTFETSTYFDDEEKDQLLDRGAIRLPTKAEIVAFNEQQEVE
ncbi:hypothetical protein [Sphingopyxis macrogoltabida]|uniref:Uncharacterized protein n=1 Tax=Sphingopyxis macrogoltabida TaxID=33050 RepID=A0AAC8Z116_SPHMC|nr:hypothetical protein [Sphingopyxis macrogoltabida]ALJ12525.1 hypothetical protein LH19_06570 [Sphingopyxis macrogoltabida]AMU89998.1 hypothetical protein ATM17_13220 [Sphingopyxis macrogoltabida]